MPEISAQHEGLTQVPYTKIGGGKKSKILCLEACEKQTHLFHTVPSSDGIHLDWCCQMNLQLCIQIQHLIATRVTGVTSMSSDSKMDKLALNKKRLETELLKTRLACIEAGCNLADS